MPRTKQQRPRHILQGRAVGRGECSSEEDESVCTEQGSYSGSSQSPSPNNFVSSKSLTDTNETASFPVHGLTTHSDPDISANQHVQMLPRALQVRTVVTPEKPCIGAIPKNIVEGPHTSPTTEDAIGNNLYFDETINKEVQIQTLLDKFMLSPFKAIAKMILESSKQSNVDGQETGYPNIDRNSECTGQEPTPHQKSPLGNKTTGHNGRVSVVENDGKASPYILNNEQRYETALLKSVGNFEEKVIDVPEEGDEAQCQVDDDKRCEKQTEDKNTRLGPERRPAVIHARHQNIDVEAKRSKGENNKEACNTLDTFTKLQNDNIDYRQPLLPWSALHPPFVLQNHSFNPNLGPNSKGFSNIGKMTPSLPNPDFWHSLHYGFVNENDPINKSSAFPVTSEAGRKRKHEEQNSTLRKEAKGDPETIDQARRNFVPSPEHFEKESFYMTPYTNGMEPKFMLPRPASPLFAAQHPALSLNFDFPLHMPQYFNAWPMIYDQTRRPSESAETKQSEKPISQSMPSEFDYSRHVFPSSASAKTGKVQTQIKHHNTVPLQNLHDQIVREAKEKNKGLDPENMYIECPVCRKRIKRLYHFQRHMRIHTGEKTHSCPNCPYKSVRKDNLKSHMKTHEKSKFDAPRRSQPRRDEAMQRYETRTDFSQSSGHRSKFQDHRQLTQSPKVPLSFSASPALPGGLNLYMKSFGASAPHLPQSGASNIKHLPFLAGAYEFPSAIHDRIVYDARAYSPFFSIPHTFQMDTFSKEGRENKEKVSQMETSKPPEHSSLTRITTTDVGKFSGGDGSDQEHGLETRLDAGERRKPPLPQSGLLATEKPEAHSYQIGANSLNYHEKKISDYNDSGNTLPINSNNCNNAAPYFLSNFSSSPNVHQTTSTSHSPTLRNANRRNVETESKYCRWQKSVGDMENADFSADSKQNRDEKITRMHSRSPRRRVSSPPVSEQNSALCRSETKYFQTDTSDIAEDESKRCHGEDKYSDDAAFFDHERVEPSSDRTYNILPNKYRREPPDTRTRRLGSAPEINDSHDCLPDSSRYRISSGRRSADEELLLSKRQQRMGQPTYFFETAKGNVDMKDKDEQSANGPIKCEGRFSTFISCRDFKCRLCDYVARNNSDLQEHMGVHKEHGLYRCQSCDYRGKNLSKLVEHKRIHTGERPFQCDQCSYAAKRKDNLAQHKSVKHDKNRCKGPARVLQLSTRLDQEVDNPAVVQQDFERAPVSMKLLREGAGRYIPLSWNSPPGRSQVRPHPLLSGEWHTKPSPVVFPGIADPREGMQNIGGSMEIGIKPHENERILGASQDFHFSLRQPQRMLSYGAIAPSFLFTNPLAVTSPVPATTLKTGADTSTYQTKTDFSIPASPTGTNQLMRAKPGVLLCQKAAQQCAQ